MRILYNHIAGQRLDRLAALSDGIFAVAMTLLVLNLHTPLADARTRLPMPALWTSQGLGKELALLGALGNLVPLFLPCLWNASFPNGEAKQAFLTFAIQMAVPGRNSHAPEGTIIDECGFSRKSSSRG